MTYSFIADSHANTESYETLKKAIKETYPDFTPDKETKLDGESCTAAFFRGKNTIYAELNFDTKEVRASANIPLYDLEAKLGIEKKSAEKQGRKSLLELIWGAGKVFWWKYLFIPLILIACTIAVLAVSAVPYIGGYIFTAPFVGIFASMYVTASMLGWLWLLPGAALAAAAAYCKKPWLYKAAAAALPVAGAVRMSIAYPDVCAEIYDLIPSVLEYLNGAAILAVPAVLLLLYSAALPYMIIDDIAGHIHIKRGGERMRTEYSAVFWCFSAVITVAVILVTGRFAGMNIRAEKGSVSAEHALYQESLKEEYARLYSEYGDDIKEAAKYAAEHKYYDWHNCPDESVREVWERLFESGAADTKLAYDPEKGSISIKFPYKFIFYVYPEDGKVLYGIDTEHYGGDSV